MGSDSFGSPPRLGAGRAGLTPIRGRDPMMEAPSIPLPILFACRVPGLNRTVSLLTKSAVRAFAHRVPREFFIGHEASLIEQMTGLVDLDGDGRDDSFRLTLTNAWFDQRILGIELSIDGLPVKPEDLVIDNGFTRFDGPPAGPVQFEAGRPFQIIARGLKLRDGFHFLTFTLRMELADLPVPGLPIVLEQGRCRTLLKEFGPLAGPKVSTRPPADEGTVHFVPHVHYDVEWLQRRDVFERVGARNLLEMLRIMKGHPDYTFALDQVPHLEPFSRTHPAAFAKIKEHVRAGRIEMLNGMYAEPDTNIPSGESLVRQSIYWQRYARETFGEISRVGWLIDSFGQSAQLPQIFKGTGTEWVAFSRSVDDDESMDSEFLWEGLDGSRVVAHWFPGMYGLGYPVLAEEKLAFEKIERGIALLQSKCTSSELLYPCGIDHGRPQEIAPEMVERWSRAGKKPGISFSTPSRFFQSLDAGRLRTIRGEFNRDHCGTFGSRIGLKILNRRAEFALLDAECSSAVASLAGFEAPGKELEALWRPVLFNQFHDILCGCCIDAVEEDASDRYRRVLTEADRITDEALAHLAGQRAAGKGGRRGRKQAEVPGMLVFNALAHERTEWTEVTLEELPSGWRGIGLFDEEGTSVPSQVVEAHRYHDGTLKAVRLGAALDMPPMGYRIIEARPLHSGQEASGRGELEAAPEELRNRYFTVRLDPSTGHIREIELAGSKVRFSLARGNQLVLERDYGNLYEPFVPGLRRACSGGGAEVGIEEDGPLRAVVRVRGRIRRSDYEQRIAIYRDIPRIDFTTDVDFRDPLWRLRVRFPTGMRQGRWVQEIPYGTMERAEHEMPAQNFVDYGTPEGEFSQGMGLTLINRGLPGHELRKGEIALTLLRSSTLIFSIDAGQGGLSLGRHRFHYSLYPHERGWAEAGSHRQAYSFNCAPRLARLGRSVPGLPSGFSAIEISPANVMGTVFMKCPDGDLLVRLFEVAGKETELEVRAGFPVGRARRTDLMGEGGEEVNVRRDAIKLRCRGHEIVTLRLSPGKDEKGAGGRRRR